MPNAFGENADQMIENLLYAKVPSHLIKSINQAFLENGTYNQIVKYLEREVELNVLEADEPSVKTQMTVTKKKNKVLKKQPKNKMESIKLRLLKTLKIDQCRYCIERGHMTTDCSKLAKQPTLEEDPDAEKCQDYNTPGHEEETFGTNMENRPPKWNLTEAHTKVIEAYKQTPNPKPIKPEIERPQQSSSSKDIN